MSVSGSVYGLGGLNLDISELSRKAVRNIRGGLALTGVLSIVLGALVLFWPEATLDVVAFLFGLYFLVSGAIRVVTGIFTPLSGGLRVLAKKLDVNHASRVSGRICPVTDRGDHADAWRWARCQ